MKKNINITPKYKLTIKNPVIYTGEYVIKQPYEVSEVIELSDNHINFTVGKTTANSPNTAKITIYNPNKELFDSLKNLNGNKAVVELEAGFADGNMDKIFSGTLDRSTGRFNGVDRELELNCTDGSLNQRESVTKRWYPKGTPLNTIFEDLIADMQCNKGFIFDFSAPITQVGDSGILEPYDPLKLLAPRSFSGNTNNILKKLGETYGVDTFILDGSVHILPPNMINNTILYTPVSPKTGLIGSPVPESDGKVLTNNSTSTNEGLKFKCLLNGGITVGGVVDLQSDDYNGIYKVTKVVHRGAFEGSFWETEVTCILTDYKILQSTQGSVLYSPTISPPSQKTTIINAAVTGALAG